MLVTRLVTEVKAARFKLIELVPEAKLFVAAEVRAIAVFVQLNGVVIACPFGSACPLD